MGQKRASEVNEGMKWDNAEEGLSIMTSSHVDLQGGSEVVYLHSENAQTRLVL